MLARPSYWERDLYGKRVNMLENDIQFSRAVNQRNFFRNMGHLVQGILVYTMLAVTSTFFYSAVGTAQLHSNVNAVKLVSNIVTFLHKQYGFFSQGIVKDFAYVTPALEMLEQNYGRKLMLSYISSALPY